MANFSASTIPSERFSITTGRSIQSMGRIGCFGLQQQKGRHWETTDGGPEGGVQCGLSGRPTGAWVMAFSQP